MADAEPTSTTIAGDHVLAEFIAPDGSKPLPRIDLPLGVTTAQLNDLLNELLQNEEALPYSFYIEGLEIVRIFSPFFFSFPFFFFFFFFF